ncbi:two-component system, LytT family, sensor kinase [Modestobacter sp. DSM 44400]|uniref:sensor histidine kinase n=1 Tax=Modestobacter sp. DSM 44400 TaxID=1550230 RepID=UPI0008944E43|nr:histidine kinase [Modestobacter sp. DSM 44400]SDX58728.1 two-component system, LytT family, sensor kinase [Modestobacter sp. DSM 44400]
MALLRRRDLGSRSNQATFDTLHTVSLIAPALREGLTGAGAHRAVKQLRTLLGVTAVALTTDVTVIGLDGGNHRHGATALEHAAEVLRTGKTTVHRSRQLSCGSADCDVRAVVASPLVEGGSVVGALVAYGPSSGALLVRAVDEVSRWVSTQLELAAADRQHSRAVEAELRALRAQISPHFIYNALTAVASFTRTDPDRARELLLEFADFTRYALRSGGQLATVGEEIRNTERYLVLEQARFGERLAVLLRVAPEVLPVTVPFLVIQPLVENAVRHGLEGASGRVTVTITAADDGTDARLTVEDDGAGASAAAIRDSLERAGRAGPDTRGMGLGNVDARLRSVFGDPYGLVVETAPGAGTKVTVRIPKSLA